MNAFIMIQENLYKTLRNHLFKGKKEQGAFLFAKDLTSSNRIYLKIENIYLIPPHAWDYQESHYLELSDEEKVKIMIMAREQDCHLIECHSHRSTSGEAYFSISDVKGIKEFISYIKWKLPGKKYGALVWTINSVCGQVWDGKNNKLNPLKEVQVLKKDGSYRKIKSRTDSRHRIFS